MHLLLQERKKERETVVVQRHLRAAELLWAPPAILAGLSWLQVSLVQFANMPLLYLLAQLGYTHCAYLVTDLCLARLFDFSI